MKRPRPHPLIKAGSGSLPTLPLHRNPGLEVVMVLRGSVKWRTESRTEEVRAGSVYFTFPWEVHGGVEEFERGHFWQFAIFQVRELRIGRKRGLGFPKVFGFSREEGKRIARTLLSASHRSWRAGKFLRELFDELIAETKSRPTKTSPGKLCGLARLILVELDRIVGQAKLTTRMPSGTKSVEQFLKILSARCDEPWTLDEMVKKSGYQRTQIANQIKLLTGDSPIRHLKRLRVERALHLLRTSDHTITEIAQRCGFSTSQHFARIFREFTRTSAGRYRTKFRSAH